MDQLAPKQHHPHQVHKPRLEIPDPTKLSGNSSSPRSMHGFPQSPQNDSPSEVKSFEWSSSPASNTTARTVDTADTTKVAGRKCPHFYAAEFVLVRCNTSKWLLGQVRRSSKTGVIVWVGAAQTLVNVPYGLLASHLVKLDSPSSQPISTTASTVSESFEMTPSGQLMAPFQCVRPAHLSHRKLYQPLRMNSLNLHHPGGVNFTINEQRRSSSAPCGSSASLPGSKTESLYDNRLIDKDRLHSSVCMFKFPEVEQSNEDASFMNKFGNESQRSSQGDWITVIENGLDIRRKPGKH